MGASIIVLNRLELNVYLKFVILVSMGAIVYFSVLYLLKDSLVAEMIFTVKQKIKR